MFGEYVSTSIIYLTTKKLFKVTENAKKLRDKKRAFLHSVVAKLLFILKRSRTDMETFVSLLTQGYQRMTLMTEKNEKDIEVFSLHPQIIKMFWSDKPR